MRYYEYKMIEEYMHKCMSDSAHDQEHVYRVLYSALDIASYEEGVKYDILVAACLLHDIARKEQFENPDLCHALVGATKAYNFLTNMGFEKEYAEAVAACIRTHRYRGDELPDSIEAKILFDADKIDATGTLGIARTLVYKGKVDEPLYSLSPNGEVIDGEMDEQPSFFQEYKFKLEKLYSKFFTKRGFEIAKLRQCTAISFYQNMYWEVKETYRIGQEFLSKLICEELDL